MRNNTIFYVFFLLFADAVPASAVQDLTELSLEDLMKIEITTVSRQASTVGQSPAAVFVITQEMIRRSGASAIPELFRMVPGMNVARVDTNKWAISARGFNDRFANKLLVQIDGRTVYNVINSGVRWDTIDYPLSDIERIEVIRGPGASVWGANAVNGVINIITKSATDTKGGLVTLGGGNEDRDFGTLRYGASAGERTDYRVYVKGFDRDKSSGLAPGPFDAWSGGSSGFRIDTHPSEADLVTLQGDYNHSDAQRIDFRGQPVAPFTYTNEEREISDGVNLLGRWTKDLDDTSRWSLQAYWDHIYRRGSGELLIYTTDIFDVDFQHELLMAERHNIVWGLGYRFTHADLTDSRFDGFILDWDEQDRDLNMPSAFLQDQIALADAWSLTLGTKLEHNDLTGFEAQPTARLLFTPGEKQSAWAAVSRAVRTPTLFEDQRTVTQAPNGTVFQRIISNPDLKSEEVVAYELGYRAQPANSLSVDTAIFYNVYDDLKVFVTQETTTEGAPAGTSFRIDTHENRMSGETYGIEISLNWTPVAWWKLYSAYSFLKMTLHADGSLPSSTRISSERAERQSPQQQVFLKSSWDLPGNVEFDVTTRFVDRLLGFQQPVDDYIATDLRLAWLANDRLTFEVVGQNVLEDHHLEVGGSILAGPLHEIERSVYGKVTYKW